MTIRITWGALKKKKASGSITKASEISLCNVLNVHENTENTCKPNANILFQWKMTLLVSFKKGWCMICSILKKKVINEFWFQEWLDSASNNNHKTEQKYSKTNKSVAMESDLQQSENRGNLILKKESGWMIMYMIFSQGHFPEYAVQVG